MTVAEIETKLSNTKTELKNQHIELDNLRSERAKLLLGGKDTKSVDRLIFRLGHITTNTPAVIEELQNQLITAQQQEQQAEHDRLVSEQQAAATRIVNLSKDLVKSLRSASKTNTQLTAEYDRYNALHRQTGESVLSPRSCEPSHQMLDYLVTILESELIDGIHNKRVILRPPCPQV